MRTSSVELRRVRRALAWLAVGTTVALIIALSASGRVAAQSSPSASPSYTAAQADHGKPAYAQHCASCHGENLDDGEFAAPLKGPEFRQKWGSDSLEPLFDTMSTTMPVSSPGTLGEAVYAQILAYMLQENGLEPGTTELPADPDVLKTMLMPLSARGPGGGLTAGVELPPAPVRPSPLDRIRPVTDDLLINPPASAWLNWRRTYDALGFSPLQQITKGNVNNLRVAWAWSLPNGPNETTPLVHDGVLFIQSYGDKVQALDAATGDLLWHYSRRLPKDARVSVKRNFSIYGDRLFVPTSDTHIVALDIKTGKVVWDKPVGNFKDGYTMTGGPLVAKGKVMIGTTGRAPGGNYIVGLDANTGEEAWRFYVIARPEEHGGNSWNGLPLEKRNGASVWVAGTYDPVLNLAYFGPAQTYDTGPLRDLVNEPGVTNDALYTDSTLAINPDTGKLVWYFQHQPNDQWDLDWAFERQLIKLPVDGVTKTVMVTAGKQAIYDGVDAATGKYVFSIDLGLQNVVTSIDPKTGAKAVNPSQVPGDGEAKMICPHAGGAKSWIPTSYNPDTKILYVPLVESCMDLTPVAPGGRGGLSTGVRWSLRPAPDSDRQYGRLQAVNLETKKVMWTSRQRAPRTTGTLATAGGVVFAGSLDRVFGAYDDLMGKELWRIRLNDVPSSAPITYMVNGTQYVAMVVGNGGAHAATWPQLVPEIKNPPDRGAAIWVFELPAQP